jgi:hypothetical protein
MEGEKRTEMQVGVTRTYNYVIVLLNLWLEM